MSRSRRSKKNSSEDSDKSPPGGQSKPTIHGAEPVRRNVFQWIDHLIFIRVDPFILGMYRVYLGLLVLAYLLMLAPSWLEYYGPNGIAQEFVMSGHYYSAFNSPLQYFTTDVQMWAFYALSIFFAVCLAAGLATRFSVLWVWMLVFSTSGRNRFVVNGEEQILCMLLFFTIFMPLDQSFSFRQLFNNRERGGILTNRTKVRAWTLVPLQIQIALVYLLSFPHKLIIPSTLTDGTGTQFYAWVDGTAVYYAMMAMNYPRWPGIELFAWGGAIISRVLTWATLVIEGVGPLLIWFRRWRVICTLSCLGLHFGLGFLLEGVVMFNGAMIAAFMIFLPSGQTRRLCQHMLAGTDRKSAFMNYLWGRDIEELAAVQPAA